MLQIISFFVQNITEAIFTNAPPFLLFLLKKEVEKETKQNLDTLDFFQNRPSFIKEPFGAVEVNEY